MNPTGPGGITMGSYSPQSLSQAQRQWLYQQGGNQGTAPVGYGGSGASGGSSNSSASNSLSSTEANQQTNFDNLLNTDNSAITSFLGKYSGDVSTDQSNAYNEFGIPTQTSNVDALTSRINDLENNTSNSGGGAESGTGMGGYASEAQVGNELNTRELPQLNASVANLNTSLGSANQQINQELAPDQAYESLLGTNIQTSMSGLNANESAQLSSALGSLEAGYGLTEDEMSAAEGLASTVLNNANTLTATQLGNEYKGVSSGDTLVNTATGGIINPSVLATNGAASIPGSGTINTSTPNYNSIYENAFNQLGSLVGSSTI
jgi:hypothetical protein